jgi:hypothetical protein
MNIYRGEKCANELFITADRGSTSVGPCGYGDHYAASYEWDISEDEKTDRDKDVGSLISENGSSTSVFE